MPWFKSVEPTFLKAGPSSMNSRMETKEQVLRPSRISSKSKATNPFNGNPCMDSTRMPSTVAGSTTNKIWGCSGPTCKPISMTTCSREDSYPVEPNYHNPIKPRSTPTSSTNYPNRTILNYLVCHSTSTKLFNGMPFRAYFPASRVWVASWARRWDSIRSDGLKSWIPSSIFGRNSPGKLKKTTLTKSCLPPMIQWIPSSFWSSNNLTNNSKRSSNYSIR